METLLQHQLETYEKQVQNGQMSPSSYGGYAKAINGARMRKWHGMTLREVSPSALREWISDMDCTSKTIRNTLIPLRSLFEDALNDELIDFNPFERIALAKLIRQTAKASDCGPPCNFGFVPGCGQANCRRWSGGMWTGSSARYASS